MTEGGKGRRDWIKQLVGGAITLVCLFIIARQVDVGEVVKALEHFHWPFLTLGIASLSLGYGLRILRWSLMLRAAGADAKWRNCATPFLGSIALNNVLPLRLGDLIRAFVFPNAMGISKTTAASSLLMERLIDLMTLLGCLAIGLVASQGTRLPGMLAESVVGIAIGGGVILIAGFLFSGRLANLCQKFAQGNAASRPSASFSRALLILASLLRSFEAMSRPRVLLTVVAVSMLVWAGESGLFYFVLRGFGFDANPALAVVVMAIATLSTLVPSSPGYIGPFHLAAFTAVSLLGGTSAQAGSYAVLVHLALWLPTTLAGAVAIWMRPSLFRAIRSGPNPELKIN
ncbi:Flippase-like domain-containing protein [Cupriavidus necator]|uniref:Flippase-like domain-containing protein n=1 Tax=Cupriavidus necator (strain ATCC 17699 / DSM 428 / KCTC 22496 / NCIMB 10442 / H16 / Stanier 337) TaxID=381666 RepID=Q0K7Q3_CUPNH|nr:lysylphosphatidylglycerol synthase transmembrane domain-containing protein [Cupriavidus necator]QCC01738.1 flippase-like domain-containing protein [Cupriavidus necator H16]QQB75431.1 flippase-like domain-containing protein [Cupriavidus necator]WKA40136.1 lysylphosphatidylglycerol synthase transmembrane domain-containing protein [Cupriavidus necator]CAJ93968.1 hypothetical membrane spanning protein [Cupriavidus necator H16]